jgi:hypothetical protein
MMTGMVTHTYNPSIRRLRQEDGNFEASPSYIVPGQPGLYGKTLSQKKKKKVANIFKDMNRTCGAFNTLKK